MLNRFEQVEGSERNGEFRRGMVFDRILGKLRPAVLQPPLLNSSPLGWRGFLVEGFRLGAYEWRDVVCPSAVIVLHLGPTKRLEWKVEGRHTSGVVRKEQVSVIAPDVPHTTLSGEYGEFVAVSIEPSFMLMACHEMMENSPPELPVQHGIDDRLMASLCMELKMEVENRGRSGVLYNESLVTFLAAHVIKKYSHRKLANREVQGGLSRRQLLQTFDFIQARIQENISLREMASVAGLSPFHFARSFKKTTGLSPYQFVLRQRVEKAKHLLVRGNLPLARVAIESGFFDQSHLTAYFKRIYGATPKQFASKYASKKAALEGGPLKEVT